jgi:hypothetical protein
VALFPIGDQRVGIERDMPVLDGDGQPVVDELGAPMVTTTTIWVDRALFEAQTPTEQAGFLVVTSTMAAAILPVAAGGTIPAVDSNGRNAPLPFFGADGTPTITAGARLLHNGIQYEMLGDAVIEQDIHGRADHVFCSCQRRGV